MSVDEAQWILIVDDEPPIRAMVAAIVRELGFIAFEAGSGTEAIAWLKKHVPRLVISDIVMPDEDGIVVANAMRRLMPQVPLVAMAGDSINAPVYLKIAKMLGAKFGLMKPFSSDELVSAIRAVLQNGSLRPAA